MLSAKTRFLMLPFVVSCRLAQLSFVLILNIDCFLCLDYLSKDRFLGSGRSFFSAGCRTGSFGRPKNTKAAPFRAGVFVSLTPPSGQLYNLRALCLCLFSSDCFCLKVWILALWLFMGCLQHFNFPGRQSGDFSNGFSFQPFILHGTGQLHGGGGFAFCYSNSFTFGATLLKS